MSIEHEKACLICGKQLVYSTESYEAVCSSCGKVFSANVKCEGGHYLCDSCHASRSYDVITHICLEAKSRNPVDIAVEIMKDPSVHMHGPEHHVLVGSALLAAFKNSGGGIDLERALGAMRERGKQLPGGICGFWGSCGAAVSAGMFLSIVTESTPLKGDSRKLCNLLTSECLKNVSEKSGARCCKRDGFISILTAAAFIEKHLGVKMELPENHICVFSARNKECIKDQCPFYP